MPKLVKFVASFIIFLLIFNLNSISYSKTYSNNDEYKLTIQKDLFFTSNESNKSELYSGQNIIEQSILVSLSSYFFISIEFIVLSAIEISNGISYSMFSSNLFSYISILIINSILIYCFVDKKEKSEFSAFISSLFSFISYFIITYTLMILESFLIKNSENTLITRNQEVFFVAIIPFISFIGTMFYHLITKEEPEEMTEEKLSKLLEEQSKSIKEFSNKVRVSGNSVSFSLVKF